MSSYWQLLKNKEIIFIDISLLIVGSLVDAENSDRDQADLNALQAFGKQNKVPAIGGIGLLALGLSMLGLGAVSLRK